jgi:roadblock/LC7 domain-containing protein
MKIASSMLDEVQKGVRAYKAFSEMEKVLEYMANLEQVEKETTAKIAVVKEELADVQNTLTTSKANIDLAKANAKTIVSDAKHKASNIIDKANAEALSLIADAQVKVNQESGKLVALQSECEIATAQKEAAAIELAELEKKILAAKTQITKLLGA